MKRHILSDNELFEIKAREYERGLKNAHKKKPKLSEMRITEKATELFGWAVEPKTIEDCIDFIRSVVNEVIND